ncbi:hypothetical protein [Helicobacter suis]|uniref:hypothetical protein n=1 Tax=Helicobacter suis TaxID=104628 RepID=UPI002492CE5B|nr:hypothetical protein [Helicobacter suis]
MESGGGVSSGGVQSEAGVKALENEVGAGQKLEGRGLQNEIAGEVPHNPAFSQNFKEFYHDQKVQSLNS